MTIRLATAWQWFADGRRANGRIDVIWNDTRDNPGGNLSSLYSYSTDEGDVDANVANPAV
jgi:hypothetical protein